MSSYASTVDSSPKSHIIPIAPVGDPHFGSLDIKIFVSVLVFFKLAVLIQFTNQFIPPSTYCTIHTKFNCARDSKSNSSEETIYKSLTFDFLFLIADYTSEFFNAALLLTVWPAQDKVKKPPSCKLTTYIICGPTFDSLITLSSLEQAS